MEGTPAMYLGRIVEKKNFRAFIYGPNGEQRLAESWEEFEANMQSGVWFASKEDAEASKVVIDVQVEHKGTIKVKQKSKPKPRPKSKSKPKPAPVEKFDEEQLDVLPDDGSVFEVKDGE